MAKVQILLGIGLCFKIGFPPHDWPTGHLKGTMGWWSIQIEGVQFSDKPVYTHISLPTYLPTYLPTERERERDRERQTERGRQRERERDRERQTERDRQRHRQTGQTGQAGQKGQTGQTDSQTDSQPPKQADRETYIFLYRNTHPNRQNRWAVYNFPRYSRWYLPGS